MTHVDWHPYPKERPQKSGWYFVTVKCRKVYIAWFFARKTFASEKIEFDFFDDEIIGWAEMDYPKPYEPEGDK